MKAPGQKSAARSHLSNHLRRRISRYGTAVKWEKRLRHPSGPALRLLQIAEKKPEVLASA
jgi:hypothetical protein